MTAKKSLRLSSAVDNCFIMAKIGLDKLKSMTEVELKILLFVAQEGIVAPTLFASKLGIEAKEAKAAVESLTECGLLRLSDDRPKKSGKNTISNYDSEDIADAIDADEGFKAVTSFTCDILEKQLNRNDLNTLYALYDYHGFSAEMICGVVEYCVSTNKRSMSYIFNTALAIQADGITSYDELEGYVKAKRTLYSKATRFRKLCGIGNRELTAKERSYTDRWFGEMKLSFDLVKKAYEVTVDRIGEPKFPYMSKILEQWFSKGVRTVEDAEKLDKKHKEEKAAEDDEFNIENYFFAAAKKGYVNNDEEQN